MLDMLKPKSDHFHRKRPAPPLNYTLSLHDALPISEHRVHRRVPAVRGHSRGRPRPRWRARPPALLPYRHRQGRSEEHTSELQSRLHLVCRLLLEKKKEALVRRYEPQLILISAGYDA